jgi:hypothetical protein
VPPTVVPPTVVPPTVVPPVQPPVVVPPVPPWPQPVMPQPVMPPAAAKMPPVQPMPVQPAAEPRPPLVPEPALPQPPDLYPSGPQPVLPPPPVDRFDDRFDAERNTADLYRIPPRPADLHPSGPLPVVPPMAPPVVPPVVPAPNPMVPPAPMSPPLGYQPEQDDTTTTHKVRSHRNGGKSTRERDYEEADPADAEELDRLLGFFDEIRKARAWDETPDWTAEDAKSDRPLMPEQRPRVPTPRFRR